jgi:hypothetical protein
MYSILLQIEMKGGPLFGIIYMYDKALDTCIGFDLGPMQLY